MGAARQVALPAGDVVAVCWSSPVTLAHRLQRRAFGLISPLVHFLHQFVERALVEFPICRILRRSRGHPRGARCWPGAKGIGQQSCTFRH